MPEIGPMQIALEASQNGIFSIVDRQAQIANNLANMNTTGYKRQTQVKSDFTVPGTAVVATPLDFSQGDPVSTGKPLDLTIAGEGFFTVNRGGLPAYTRAGALTTDRDGNLVTAQGYPIEPAITVPEGANVEVRSNGVILDIQEDGSAVELGRLEAVRFRNPQGLIPVGDGLFLQGSDSGTPLSGNFEDQGFPRLMPRTLEQSNVDMTREVTDELVTQRAFQANIRAFQTADRLIGNALDLFR